MRTCAVSQLSIAVLRWRLCNVATNPGLRTWVLAAVLPALVAGAAMGQNLGPYTFTLIDSQPSGYDYRVGNPSNLGQVPFTRYDPNGSQTVYLGSGGGLIQIADLTSPPGFSQIGRPAMTRNEFIFFFIPDPCTSATGGPSIVFDVSLLTPGNTGIYVGGPQFLGVFPIVQGSFFVQHGGINDNGVVAYTQADNPSDPARSVWKYDGFNPSGPVQIDVEASHGIPFGPPGINNDYFGSGILSGTVAYYSPNGDKIILDSNLHKSILATSCSGGHGGGVGPFTGINNNEIGAYTGSASGGETICTKGRGATDPENLLGTLPSGFLSILDVNVEGIVAFEFSQAGFLGIYTGTDLVNDRVVANGDVLPDGNTVTSIDFGGINDNCQISFSVHYRTPAGATGSAVWRADAAVCQAPCPPQTVCGNNLLLNRHQPSIPPSPSYPSVLSALGGSGTSALDRAFFAKATLESAFCANFGFPKSISPGRRSPHE